MGFDLTVGVALDVEDVSTADATGAADGAGSVSLGGATIVVAGVAGTVGNGDDAVTAASLGEPRRTMTMARARMSTVSTPAAETIMIAARRDEPPRSACVTDAPGNVCCGGGRFANPDACHAGIGEGGGAFDGVTGIVACGNAEADTRRPSLTGMPGFVGLVPHGFEGEGAACTAG